LELEELRDEIKRTDIEILVLMKKRLDLAKEVGLCKIKSGKEIVNSSVEDEVVDRYRSFAEKNGMDPDRAEDVCRILIGESVELQRSLR
jgi:chorismate mutase